MIALGSAFYQDPNRVTNFKTAGHDNAIGKWNDPQSKNPHIKITSWEPATDTHSGIKGYFTKWDKISSTIPTYTDSDLSEVTLYDGRWYFHIRSVDNAGNWNKAGNGMYSTAHLGPICIDTVAPFAVTGLTSSTHEISKWSKDKNITMVWIAAEDDPRIAGNDLDISGIGGYSVAWNAEPDMTKDIGNDTSCSKQLADGKYTFKIKSVDKAGNWGNEIASAGLFWIDVTKPKISIQTINVYKGINPDGSSWGVAARDFGVRIEDPTMNGVYSGLAMVSFNGRTHLENGRQSMNTTIHLRTPAKLQVTAKDIAGNTSSQNQNNPDPYFIQYPETIIFDPLLKEFAKDIISPTTSIGIKDNITIPYEIPEPLSVLTRIFNSQGNLVKIIENTYISTPGSYSFTWDGKNTNNAIVQDGNYYYLVEGVNPLTDQAMLQKHGIIIVDNTLPQVTITSAELNMPYWGNLTLTSNINESNISGIKAYYKLTSSGTYAQSEILERAYDNGTWKLTLDTRTWPDGAYDVKVECYDYAGNADQAITDVNIQRNHTNLEVYDVAFGVNFENGEREFISYFLSRQANVKVEIYTPQGALIKTLYQGLQNSGDNTIYWDRTDSGGQGAVSGDYVYEITSPDDSSFIYTTDFGLQRTNAEIVSPSYDCLIRGYVPIEGTATGEEFQSYTLDYGEGENPETWIPIATSTTPIDGGLLAYWDTGYEFKAYCTPGVNYPSEGLNGVYTLRLTVTDTAGRQFVERIKVIVGRVISNELGGEGKSPDEKVKFKVEPLSIDTSYLVVAILPSDNEAIAPQNMNVVGSIYEFMPPYLTLLQPAILEMSYTDKDLDLNDDGQPDVDEAKLGIYWYDFEKSKWMPIDSERDIANNVLTTKVIEILPYRAYYAILEDDVPPEAPIIFEPLSPINKQTINIYGLAEESSSVEVFLNTVSFGILKAAEGDGWYSLYLPNLIAGGNTVTSQAKDKYNNVSPLSTPRIVLVELHPPSAINSVSLKNEDFSSDFTGTIVRVGDKLYVEVSGVDSSPSTIDITSVRVTSSITDPTGIIVVLTETGPNTGIYRGIVYVGARSSSVERTIAALNSEVLTIASTIDPSKNVFINVEDTTIPEPPLVYTTSGDSICQDTFEVNLGDWANRSGIDGASVYRDNTTSATGLYSVKLVNEKNGGDFSCYVLRKSFQAEEFPVIRFDYKIPEDAKINMRLFVNGLWHEVRLTDDLEQVKSAVPVIGAVSDMVADGEWHYAEIDIYKMLKAIYPNTSTFTVSEIIMGEWDMSYWYSTVPGENNAQGATYWMDNLIITKPISQPFEICWDPPSGEPIVGYSYSIDRVADNMPDGISEGTATSITYTGLADGVWYFHIMAQDGSGNWSNANHYMVIKDDTPPIAYEPNPAQGVTSSSPTISLIVDDYPGVGVDEETIRLQVENVTYDTSSPALDYDPETKILTFMPYKLSPTSVVFADGQEVNVSLLSVSDKAGNAMTSPYSWSWIYDVDTDTTPPEAPTILFPKSNIANIGKVIFTWIAQDTSGIQGYSFILDDSPSTIVDTVIDGTMRQQVYELAEGTHYFHVAAVDNAGNWSETTHFELTVIPVSLAVDDFDDGVRPNLLGGDMDTFPCLDGSTCTYSYINTTGVVMGGYGYSLRLDYNILYGSSFAGYWTAFIGRDISMYKSLEFWVRGAVGGEKFTFYLKDRAENESKLNIADYLPDGVTTTWQKVTVPLNDFNQIMTWNDMDSFVITFEGMIGSGSGTIYVDGIKFVSDNLPVDNFDAGKPLNEPGSPYWFANNGADIAVSYEELSPFGGSGKSIKLEYTGVTTGFSCSWLRELGNMDVSNMNMLGFCVKGALGGEHFNVYLNDGSMRAYVDIRDYITLRDDWHYVRIPLMDFAAQGLDLSKLLRLEIVFEWQIMSGIIFIDNIEFTNGLFKEPSTGPVKIYEQKLLVGGNPFIVRGVGYQPTPIGYYPYNRYDGSPYIDVFADTPYNRTMWARDLEYLREMHCNTIRTWGAVTSEAFLDACYNNGVNPIYVIMGYWLDCAKDYSDYAKPNVPENRIDVLEDFVQYVQTYKDHPAVLIWAIGNEDNYWYPGYKRGLYTLINEMARTAYEAEGSAYHPVMFPSRELVYMGEESVRSTDFAMNYLDIWGVNTYRGNTFGDLFSNYQFRSTKPFVITEYGIDAWDNMASPPTEYEDMQASYATALWDEIAANENFCMGGVIMEYCDEWWKDDDLGSYPDSHDYGGYENEAHPDGFSNEEWWGIMRTVDNGDSIDMMAPREVYYALKDKWSSARLIDDFNDGGTDPNNPGSATSTYVYGTGSTCSRTYYNTDPDNVLGGLGYSMKIQYNISGSGAYGRFDCALNSIDARKYNAISFWVKGNAGGELFKVALKDNQLHETKIMITDYLSKGVTTEWQKVIIPFAAFKAVTYLDKVDIFSLYFESAINSGSGAIYIDDIKMEMANASIFVDNFNDNISANALGGSSYPWGNASMTVSYDTASPYGGLGKSLCLEYNVSVTSYFCGWTTRIDYLNASSKDTLSFYIKGAVGGEKPNIYLKDTAGHQKCVDVENYATVSTIWQKVNIPLTDFSASGVNVSDLAELTFKFEYGIMSGTIYLDEIAFTNYSIALMPALNEIPEFSNTTPITLTGNKPKNTAVVINGVQVIALNADTSWSYDLPLINGSNIIRITTRDTNGSESEAVTASVVLDTEPPAISITSPHDNTGTSNASVIVEGTVSDEHLSAVDVIVEGVSGWTEATVNGGNFSCTVDIPIDGRRAVIVARATDTAGNTSTDCVGIIYGYMRFIKLPHYYQKGENLFNLSSIAVVQDMLDFMRPEPDDIFPQDCDIYNYAHPKNLAENQALTELDPNGMDAAVEHYDIYTQGYNFSIESYANTPQDFATYLKEIIHWMSWPVLETWSDYPPEGIDPKDPLYSDYFTEEPYVPVMLPLYGDVEGYSRWIVVNGCASNIDPFTYNTQPWKYAYDITGITIYGLFLTDSETLGIGQDVYITSSELANYLKPLPIVAIQNKYIGDKYAGKYVMVAEPPEEEFELECMIAPPNINESTANLLNIADHMNDENISEFNKHLVDSALVVKLNEPEALLHFSTGGDLVSLFKPEMAADYSFAISWKDIIDPMLLLNENFKKAIQNSVVREFIKVCRIDVGRDYYIIPFDKYTGGQFQSYAAILIDGEDGHFIQASYVEEPTRYVQISKEEAIQEVMESITKTATAVNIEARLIWKPGGPTASPFYPYWEVTVGDKKYYVVKK
ncbi:MAG: hypothetical protein KKI13_02515 [Candidatus Omnitrophica bacterium]|nr:hypothetical protein [Candidatus Omnitrophota bacterium]